MTRESPTIFAMATAPGRAAVAIIRISGPLAATALKALAPGPMRPRRASLRTLRRPSDGAILDQALLLWFPGPRSATGEDCAELHLHGGSAVVDSVTQALLSLDLRLAEPGEFTRRAFERGRLDLSQAEAVADLVDAETDSQRRQALAQLGGALSSRHKIWRDRLIEALSALEAAVDFPDEDLPAALSEQARAPIAEVAADIDAAIADGARGERVRDGYRIALIGAPNAGKSSLLNALARRDAAIVTPVAGTTRDVIEVALDLAGFRVLVSDTAGLRATEDPIEAEGVRRARDRARAADLRVMIVDRASETDSWRPLIDFARAGDFCLLNKADLAVGSAGHAARLWAEAFGLVVAEMSLSTGQGLPALDAALSAHVTAALSGAEFPAATRARHRQDLIEAQAGLERALKLLESGGDVELVAEDVRLATRSLARVGGRIGSEDVLDHVFSRFCIGK